MKASFLRPLGSLLLLLALPQSLKAQQPGGPSLPRIGYLFPAGAQKGTTVEIKIGGQFIQGTNDVFLSGSGIKATILKIEKPLPQRRLAELREYLSEGMKTMREKGGPKARTDFPAHVTQILTDYGATEDEIAFFLKDRRQRNDYKRQQNQQLSETLTLKVEVAPDAVPGPRAIRLVARYGISNPLSFCVGQYPEISKTGTLGKATPLQVTLPAVINGQLLPGEVDHFQFQANRGARIVVAVQARDLLPFLADAVPGWFQPVASLWNSKGKEVVFSEDYRFSPDPVFCYEVPENGTYLLKLNDALYRGREDFVYRITVGAVPFVTGIEPMGGRTGKPVTVAVSGWNLKAGASSGTGVPVVLDPGNEVGIRPVASLNNGRAIGEIAFATDAFPEIRETKPEQPLKLPVIVNGRIQSPGEIDSFSFSATKGEKVVAEIHARRLGSPLDSWLKVLGPGGQQVAYNDDWQETGDGYLTHKADSYLLFTAPESGSYTLQVGDSQRKGGSEFAYRLRVSPPQPDFALRIVPSSLSGRPGFSSPVTLFAQRKDGFSGPIRCSLKDAPAGLSLDGGTIPEGMDKIRATVTFPSEPIEKPTKILVEGSALISGSTETTHPVAPADDMLQAFFYHHLVPAESLLAFSNMNSRRVPPFRFPGLDPVQLPAGGKGQFMLNTNSSAPRKVEDIRLKVTEPAEGISVEKISAVQGGVAIELNVDPAKVKPGQRGNLFLDLTTQYTLPAKAGKPAETRSSPLGNLPAIPYLIVEPAK